MKAPGVLFAAGTKTASGGAVPEVVMNCAKHLVRHVTRLRINGYQETVGFPALEEEQVPVSPDIICDLE